jgi:predicted ATPase
VGGLADVLVGRDAELAVLDSLVSRAAAGAGGVVLLAGEPGVGKTRLAREITEPAPPGLIHVLAVTASMRV